MACVRFPLASVAGEVEPGFGSGAGAGYVPPFLEGAVVGEQDECALDGGALRGVTGERVAVLEVLGGVGAGQEAQVAAVCA
jgi:hypothetical protein